MSFKLEVHINGKLTEIETQDQQNLLYVLRENDFDVYAPCGGKGTCGKCQVDIKDIGRVAACRQVIDENLTVILPEHKESQILIKQHQYSFKLPLEPGTCIALSKTPFGVAVDLGTTSIVFYLIDLIDGGVVKTKAIPNPQARFGADVITRIDYASKSPDNLLTLQNIIIETINHQLDHFISTQQLNVNDLVKISIAGNTTMLHLLMNVDPLPIALVPFKPRFIDRQVINASIYNLHCNPEALVETLPGASAYVGADVLAGLASIAPPDNVKTWLLMDIGTNGELVLITPENVYCCAAPAGPAFEGARIEHGMLAVDGAISSYTESGYTVIGNIAPMGICGSGLIDLVAYLVNEKIIDSEGLLENSFEIVNSEQSGTGEPIELIQKDIRELQLAKSAIAAGVNILLKRAGVAAKEVDAVFLAGGFGNYLNTKSAIDIGLLHPDFEGKIIPIGNASGTGATLTVKSEKFHDRMKIYQQRMINIELSDEESFALEFAMNMFLGDGFLMG